MESLLPFLIGYVRVIIVHHGIRAGIITFDFWVRNPTRHFMSRLQGKFVRFIDI